MYSVDRFAGRRQSRPGIIAIRWIAKGVENGLLPRRVGPVGVVNREVAEKPLRRLRPSGTTIQGRRLGEPFAPYGKARGRGEAVRCRRNAYSGAKNPHRILSCQFKDRSAPLVPTPRLPLPRRCRRGCPIDPWLGRDMEVPSARPAKLCNTVEVCACEACAAASANAHVSANATYRLRRTRLEVNLAAAEFVMIASSPTALHMPAMPGRSTLHLEEPVFQWKTVLWGIAEVGQEHGAVNCPGHIPAPSC